MKTKAIKDSLPGVCEGGDPPSDANDTHTPGPIIRRQQSRGNVASITAFETLIRNAACLDAQTRQTRSLPGAGAERRSLKSASAMQNRPCFRQDALQMHSDISG